MKKLAFFDFCETLVSFQTADAFVDYVRKMEGKSYMKCLNWFIIVLCKFRITTIFNKFFPYSSFEKKVKLLQIRGFTYEKLNNLAASYYCEMIKPNLVVPVIAELLRLKQQDYEVCIVSAGYSIYLKYFAEEYHINNIISTEIGFDQANNRCLGTISGKDCINVEKIKRIKAIYSGQSVDYNECVSYSDSITDLPMLLLTGRGVVVSRNHTQTWSHVNNLKEIIWN